ncbi:MAG: ABC transporter substrate-binding protein [Clostridiales bacterium]|nr:ABC transporter substrate-binding protein [Clostridiales bacterium]
MRSKFSRILALVLAAMMLVALAACGETPSEPKEPSEPSEPVAAGETIKIGGLFNITGGQASLDEPSSKGFRLAIDEINANGGINGRMLEGIIYDGKTEQTTCANQATKMIDVDGVVAIGGLSDSNYAMAAGTVAQEAGVPILFSGATTPSLCSNIGDCAFLTPFGDDTDAYACAEYAYNDLGYTKCYLLIDQSMEFTTALARYFQERFEELGGEIVLTDNYMNKDPDFSAQIDRYLADNKGAEFMFFASVPDDAGPLVSQFRAKGVEETIISGDGFDTPLLWEVGGEAAEGVIVGTHCSFENPDEIMQAFVTSYTETYGVTPENAFAALGYDCVKIIAKAIEMCGDDITPANIRDNLEQIQDFRIVTGAVSYSAESHVPAKSVSMLVVKDGAFSFLKEIG